jgi:hypothetical protein
VLPEGRSRGMSRQRPPNAAATAGLPGIRGRRCAVVRLWGRVGAEGTTGPFFAIAYPR